MLHSMGGGIYYRCNKCQHDGEMRGARENWSFCICGAEPSHFVCISEEDAVNKGNFYAFLYE